MSREVLDRDPAAGDWVIVDRPVEADELSLPSGAGPASGPWAPSDEPEQLEDPGGQPGERRRRRPVLTVGWVAALAVVALLVGVQLGGWQAQQDARRAVQANTRILLSVTSAFSDDTSGIASFDATGRTLGGPLLLHTLHTPYGVVTFSPDVALDPLAGVTVPIRFRPDCSSYTQWQDDWTKAPRTASATVRDRPGDPVRTAPVDLTGDLLYALVIGPCLNQASTQTYGQVAAVTTAGGPVPLPVAQVFGMTGSADGFLAVRVRLTGGPGPITVRLRVNGPGQGSRAPAGGFAFADAAPTADLYRPGEEAQLVGRLVFSCPPPLAGAPDPGTVADLQVSDGTTGAPVEVTGWEPVQVAVAARGAMATAGCLLLS